MILDGTQALLEKQPAGKSRQDAVSMHLAPFYSRDDEPVRLCVALELSGKEWRLNCLRSFSDGRVYLGALTDSAGRVREWLEIWVQSVAGIADSIRARGMQLDNNVLDLRWQRMAAALKALNPDACIDTGFETKHPAPAWIDAEKLRMFVPSAETAATASLCRDDNALAAAGLPRYSTSLARYMWIEGRLDLGFLEVAAAGRNTENRTEEQRQVPVWAQKTDSLLPLNPEGGLVFVRRRAALKFEDYAQYLGGSDLQGVHDDAFASQYFGGLPAGIGRWNFLEKTRSSLLPTSRGKPGRFLETFHHKLLMFSKMVKAVRATVAAQQLPMLNLSPSSFRVSFAESEGDLPWLWTASPTICEQSAAIALPLPATQLRYFRTLEQPDASIYKPGKVGLPIVTNADVRIRRVVLENDETTIECTVSSAEPLNVADRDLIWLELAFPGQERVDLFGKLGTAQALATGECRFVSAAMTLTPRAINALRQNEGRVITGVPVETIPLMSTPCDLYALGVLGVQLFLTSSANHPLPVALDEMLSLACQMDTVDVPSPGARAKTLAMKDRRWNENMGPQHHGHKCASADEAFAWMPVELWWDVMATLARFFPGAGGCAFLRNYEDVPPDMERVFDAPCIALNRLVQASQSLLLSDWVSNREIARVIQQAR